MRKMVSEEEIMNVLKFPYGEIIYFITRGEKRSEYLLQMPGEILRINRPDIVWKCREMKMPFEKYKKKYPGSDMWCDEK